MQLMDENYADAYELLESMDPAVQDFVKTLPFRLGKRLPTEVHLLENASKRLAKYWTICPNQNMSS